MNRIEVLIVDDSPADRTSLRIAFERSGFPLNMHFASSGASALAMLRGDAIDSKKLTPHVMVVDVKMPGISGLDLLSVIKSDETLLKIPVIMFSGSDDAGEIDAAYRNFASGYIKKPSDIVGLNEIASVIGRLCSEILVFPK